MRAETFGLVYWRSRIERLELIRNKKPKWDVMYEPLRDLLVLRFSSPFESYDTNFHVWLDDLLVSESRCFDDPLPQIGIEFRDEWYQSIRKSVDGALYLPDNIYKSIFERFFRADYLPVLNIWIIDPTATASPSSPMALQQNTEEVVFYDLDQEYVCVSQGFCHTNYDRGNKVACFLSVLRGEIELERAEDVAEFDECVGVLARRDFPKATRSAEAQ